MEIKILKHTLQLKHAFTISRGSRNKVDSIIVSLHHNGFTGLGEATANPYYGTTADIIGQDLERLNDFLRTYSFSTPEKLWQEVAPKLENNSFALCALDMAAHDLYGKIKAQPLYKIWGLDLNKLPISNFTIGIDEIDVMKEKMEETPWPIYKIKLGTSNDLEIVKSLRKATNALFRVDANGDWDASQCISFSKEFKNLNVEFLEQPLPANASKEAQLEVFKHSHLPIIADESCITEKDVEKCHGLYHGVNIKLMKCGGITPAKRMIAKAKTLGMKVMIGCMTESSVGISAISQLTPLLDYVDMDGAMLLSNDPASGVILENGKILMSENPGIGARLN